MSHFRAIVGICGLLVVAAVSGCGKSQPPAPAQSAPAAAGATTSASSTDLGTATYQPAAPASAQAQPAAAAPASGSMLAGPTVTGPAVTGPTVTGPTVTGPTVTGPAVTGPTVTGPAVASASPSTVPAAPPAPPTPGVPPAAGQAAPAAPQAGKAPYSNTAASGDINALAAAANQWRLQGGSLAGAKRIPDKPVVAGYSWMTHLLPHLGHGELYQKFDFNKGWHDQANIQLTCEVIPAFIDPANPNRNMQIVGAKNVIGPAFTHFVGMAGIEDARNVVAAELPRTDPRAGIFGYDQVAKPEEITDGASHTLMLVSSGKIVGPWAAGGGATVRGARAPYFDSITGFHSVGDASGGAVAAMADGSVRRISKDIDPAVFRALCTIHGGEKADLPAK